MANKEDSKSLVAGLFKGGIYRLMYMGFLFAIGLLIAAISGASTFGVIALMIANAAILQIITGLGTDSSLVWHGSGGGFGKEKLYSFAFITGLIQITLFVFLYFLVYNITGKQLLSWQEGMGNFSYELLYFSSLVIVEKYSSILYARHRAVDCNKILAFAAVLVFIYLILIYGKIIKQPKDMIALYCIISSIPALFIMIFYHWLPGKLFSAFSRRDLKSFYQFSLVVFITNLIQFMAYRADYWLIDYFQDTTQVGIYAQANRFAQLLWVIPNILAGMLAPLLATGTMEGARLVIMTRLLSYFNLLLVVVIAIVSWIFYQYFLGAEFITGYSLLFLLLPGYFFFCLNILFAAWFSANRQLWINLAGSALCLVIVFLFDWILIPRIGIEGAAIANLVAYSIAGFFHLFMFMRSTQTSVGEFFRFNKEDWRRILKLQS